MKINLQKKIFVYLFFSDINTIVLIANLDVAF